MLSCHRLLCLCVTALCLSKRVNGFSLKVSPKPALRALASARLDDIATSTSRKSFINQIAYLSIAVGVATSTEPAYASGGATAGGAYLLSAKQRYNERVRASVKGLLGAGEDLAAGNSKPAKAYFASEEAGGWKDLTAAGYLLSNAFRRNSTTAPDSLPAVKKYKAFAAEIDSLQKVLKKKGAAAAADEFSKVEVALDTWLNEIDLPNAREL